MYTSIVASNVRVGMTVAVPSKMPGLNLQEVVSVDYHQTNKDQLIVSVLNAPYAFVIPKFGYLIVTQESVLYPNNHQEVLNWLQAPG